MGDGVRLGTHGALPRREAYQARQWRVNLTGFERSVRVVADLLLMWYKVIGTDQEREGRKGKEIKKVRAYHCQNLDN